MTAPEFAAIGEDLLGPSWRPPLARLLRVNVRTLQRWANGQNPIPEPIAGAVLEIQAVIRDIWPAAYPPS